MNDFTLTLDSDSDSERVTQNFQDDGIVTMDPEFTFSANGLEPELSFGGDAENITQGGLKVATVEDIIARRVRTNLVPPLKRRRNGSCHSSESASDTSEELDDVSNALEEDSEIPADNEGSTSQSRVNNDSGSEDQPLSQFFSNAPSAPKANTFLEMNLSRPLLKALANMAFEKPTPIQSAAIPVGLMGSDIVGAAVTGSGKTAAFLIPVLERLIHKDKSKRAAATRCLVLVPTRELAIQCFEVGKKLASHMEVQFCVVVGGLSLKSQETALRARPDIVIATPGRLIDHLHNSPNFSLDTLDVLILDEADRMLEDGFHDELSEIVKSCPGSRQTMLFSATMTDTVNDLVKMSLNNPVKLFVDAKNSTAKGLLQEFVRVRSGKEQERSAILLALCRYTFRHKVIVFLRSKKLAHQLRIAFGVLGSKCGELHGDLTQEQRLAALRNFREGGVDILLATDLASRGLDIKGIETVINYDMPTQIAQYLHRVGRTARAGRKGRSITLVGESDRKMLKSIIKYNSGLDKVRHRVIDPETVSICAKNLSEVNDDVLAVLREEKEEKAVQRAEMELRKGQNMIEHEKEIFSRPARVWFQSGKQKEESQKISQKLYEGNFAAKAQSGEPQQSGVKRDKHAGLSRKAKRRKLALEEDAGTERAVNASIRQAKKLTKPSKIGEPDVRTINSRSRSSKKQKQIKTARKGVGFEHDMGDRGRR